MTTYKLFTVITLLYLYIFYISEKKTISFKKSYTCNYKYSSNINNNIYIYSSNIKENEVQLIGVSNPYKKNILYCILYYNHISEECKLTLKKLYNTNRYVNMTYIVIYIKFNKSYGIPSYVNINMKNLPIFNYTPHRKYNIVLAIVNFHNIKSYKQIIDVIEISKKYGVEHIIIYATSSSIFIKNILYYYVKLKYVEIMPFCFNEEIKYVHETGQIEKMNDVLYKYMDNTKYIIFSDVDEIIVPLKTFNYLSTIKLIDNYSSDIYIFKSKLFPYFSSNYESITKFKKCCLIEKGYEKYIVGNLYKFSVLSVHIYLESFFSIKNKLVNKTYGYVRHTRYYGKMCKTSDYDKSMDYLEEYLSSVYYKFEKMYKKSNKLFFFGKE